MPTNDDAKRALDLMSRDRISEESLQLRDKWGLDDEDLDDWEESKAKPEAPESIKTKNFIYKKIADNTPSSESAEGILSTYDRFGIENLLEEPELQLNYARRKGLDARMVDGELEVRKPDSPQWSRVDAKGFDLWDFTDVMADALEALAVGGVTAATTAAGGPVAGVLGGAATATAFDVGKQALATGLGFQEDFVPERPVTKGLIGAITEPVGGAVVRPLSKLGQKGVSKLLPPLKETAEATKRVAKELGVKPTPGQLIDVKFFQDMEDNLVRNSSSLGGLILRKRTLKGNKRARDTMESFFDNESFASGADVSEKVKSKIMDRLEPMAEEYNKLYDELEPVMDDAWVDLVKIEGLLDKVEKKYSFNEELLAKIEKLWQKTADTNRGTDITSLDTLKKLRTEIGSLSQKAKQNQDWTAKAGWDELYVGLTDLRREALTDPDFLRTAGPEAAEKLEKAEGIYKAAIKSVNDALLTRKQAIKGSPMKTAQKIIEESKPVQLFNRLFDVNDPKKAEAAMAAFPEAFEEVRKFKVSEVINKYRNQDGDVALGRLAKHLRGMDERAATLMFGEKGKRTARDMAQFVLEYPKILNPSGTATKIQWDQFLNPFFQAGQLFRSGALRAGLSLAEKRALLERSLEASTDEFFKLPAGTAVRAGTFTGLKEAARDDEKGLRIPEPIRTPLLGGR